MAKPKATKVASKKHLARLERERRQTIAITYTAIVLIVAVVVLIVYGILSQTVLLARQPIVKLGNQVTTTREFQMRVRVRRQQLISQYLQYVQFAQMFGIDPNTDSSMSQQLSSITGELDNSVQLGQNIIDEITENMLVRQYAAANNITVTKAEVDKDAYNAFGYYPDGTSTPTLTPTEIVYPTLSQTQLALVPPTATLTPVLTPTLAPTFTPTITATLDLTNTPLPTNTSLPTDTPTVTPTFTATLEPTVVPTITETPSITPSPTPYTLEGFQTQFNNIFPTYQKLGMTEADFRRIFFEDNLLRTKVYDAITADVLPVQEQVWARHILVADETTAKTVRTLLLAGGDFSTLAAAYSLDTSNKSSGGDLGWFGKGAMVAEFETAAFSLPVGAISDPVQTTNGWHIIQVLGHENRPLTAAELKTAKDKIYQDWLTNVKSTATTNTSLKVYDYWMSRVPTDPTIDSVYATMQTQQAQTQAAAPTGTAVPETPTP
jgi:peptidyl-prolyl cis-trans isomerase D